MPKQRNHQHHRRRDGARTGLRLPWISYSDPPFVGSPTIHYPDGWTRRPFPTRKLAILYLKIAAVCVALMFGVALLIVLLGGR